MESIIQFRLAAVRIDGGAIREAEGRIGIWPFSRTLRFCIGINCDAIESGETGVAVYRHGALIAQSSVKVTRRTTRIGPIGARQWLQRLALPSQFRMPAGR